MTSWVCALAVPGGPLARRGSSYCPSRSLRLIAVVTRCSSGIFGSSSHACGTSPVQTVPSGTWLAGLRSCTGHSGNSLSSQSWRFWVSAVSPHSGSACHAIFSCRFPCWPGVASRPFLLARNHTNCFGPFECGSEYPLYFCAVWPFEMHGVRFSYCEEWACLGLWLRLWFGRRRHWGCSRCRLGSFGPAGGDARPLGTRPWLASGLLWRRLGGWLRRVAVVEVVEDAVCRPLALTGSVHTLKFVRMVL